MHVVIYGCHQQVGQGFAHTSHCAFTDEQEDHIVNPDHISNMIPIFLCTGVEWLYLLEKQN